MHIITIMKIILEIAVRLYVVAECYAISRHEYPDVSNVSVGLIKLYDLHVVIVITGTL